MLQPSLKDMLRSEMSGMKPLKSIYYPDFIAANQKERADHVHAGDEACWDHVTTIKEDIS